MYVIMYCQKRYAINSVRGVAESMTERQFWDSIGKVYESDKVKCKDCLVYNHKDICNSCVQCGDAIRMMFYLYVGENDDNK